MPVNGIKTVAAARNGVGAFILPCRTLHLHYCDWAGSSRGLAAYLTSPAIRKLTSQYPSIEFRISPRPGRHPVLRAQYTNGREKAVCVRNMDATQVGRVVEYLAQHTGRKNLRVGGKKVASLNESVRGIWSPFHGGFKAI